MRVARATTVALVVGAFLGCLAQPAYADDPVTNALKKKEELERAVQISRANAERYQVAANQFQAVVNQTNARIAALATKQANAQSKPISSSIRSRSRRSSSPSSHSSSTRRARSRIH